MHCCCRVNQEVKRAPKNSISTQVDQHNKEHAGDRDRLLSCQIKWHGAWLLETDNKQCSWSMFCCGHVACRHARWVILWHVGDALKVLSFERFPPLASRVNEKSHHFWCFLSPYLSGSWGQMDMSTHIPCHYITHLSWQAFWLHIIWVISLYFYAADVSPCQQGPRQSKMENPPLLM